ncbi:DUF6355 family natural product biosynthesis protein [Embleya sp. NBC_00896]|uniref:DUF6355 family natural product biosynthesis protein n=1 Tax=Embleya sp. NBC_00896 TaxID=2975961 RepID=UPI002F918D79|nr:DUF6355 family natural product biosynthesis protein [Embleya sp. NBC_00896]
MNTTGTHTNTTGTDSTGADATATVTRRRRFRSAAVLTAVALAASVAGVVGTAGSASAQEQACGYYEHGDTGYFANCGGEDVTIEIDDWGPNSYACVKAHETKNIGSAWDIDDAWVIHNGCNP